MTWAKYGTEFWDQAADAGLSDAAARTHAEAIAWLYKIDREDVADLSIPKHIVRRFAASPSYEAGITELLTIGWWVERGEVYVVEHHGDVIRSSLMVQRKKREIEKERQRRRRAAERAAEVGANVGTNVGTNVGATQTDRQTVSYVEVRDDVGASAAREPEPALSVVDPSGPWSSVPADSPADRGEMCGETVVGGQRCTNPPTGRDHSGRPFCDQHLRARKTA